MDISQTLRDLRAQLPGCQAIGLADLSTDMLLKSDSAGALAQETWDELTGVAVTALTGPHADEVAQALDPAGQSPLRFVIQQDDDGAVVMIRSVAEPAMGFVMICDGPADPGALVPPAQAGLEGIVSVD